MLELHVCNMLNANRFHLRFLMQILSMNEIMKMILLMVAMNDGLRLDEV